MSIEFIFIILITTFIFVNMFNNFILNICLQAIDKDSEPPNNVVHYEIVSGNYNNKFAINAETGNIN